jgi:hypothetical protein
VGEEEPALKLVQAVEHGDVDVAVLWGPFAGLLRAQEAGSSEHDPGVEEQ